jgi:hypothetical protein
MSPESLRNLIAEVCAPTNYRDQEPACHPESLTPAQSWRSGAQLPSSGNERTNPPPPIEGGGRTPGGRLEREMRGLTSMAWDDKCAH